MHWRPRGWDSRRCALVLRGMGLPARTRGPSLEGRYPRAMATDSNTLDDFPAESFAILVLCEACGRQRWLDHAKVPTGVTVQALRERLRCSGCGSRQGSIRIVYSAAGGFRYGGGSMASA